MLGRLKREDARNVRVETFITTNAADFAGNAVMEAQIPALAAANQAVAVEEENQLGGDAEMREGYDIYDDAFDEMIEDMETLRDFTVSLAQTIPGLENKFRIPRAGGKPAKITAAYVFADDANEIRTPLAAMGLPADFIANLRAKADRAQQSLNNAEAATGRRVGATGALAAKVKTANDIVEAITPIGRFVYRKNPAKLTEWNHIIKVERHTPVPRQPKP